MVAIGEPIPARPAIVRGNVWHLRNSLTPGFANTSFVYGRGDDFPLMGDWDGDGTKTPGVVRGNVWYLRNSTSSGFADVVFAFGKASDIPIAGDWNGDGIDTPGVFRQRPETCGNIDGCNRSTWHLRNNNSQGPADLTFDFSFVGIPIVGDWDGDEDDTPGVRLLGLNRWELSNENVLKFTPDVAFNFGSAGDFPIAGDWDADEDESAGVVRGNTWFLKNANASGVADSAFDYGSPTDFPLVWGIAPG
jgi:hypothetical protein